jgi:hypothetical protein
MGHFPAGMELFPSANETPWELIEQVINESDYYVLIIAGKYGSLSDEGISFTEREYDHAHAKGKYVLPFVHEDPEGLLVGDRLELDVQPRKKLDAFRTKVESNHTRVTWRNPEELAGKVALALISAISRSPSVGWIRGDATDPAVIRKLAKVEQRNRRLKTRLDQLQKQAQKQPHLTIDEVIEAFPLPQAKQFSRFAAEGVSVPGGRIDPSESPQMAALARLFRLNLFFLDRTDQCQLTKLGFEVLDGLRKRLILRELAKAPKSVRAKELADRLGIAEDQMGFLLESLRDHDKVALSRNSKGEFVSIKGGGRVHATRIDSQFEQARVEEALEKLAGPLE